MLLSPCSITTFGAGSAILFKHVRFLFNVRIMSSFVYNIISLSNKSCTSTIISIGIIIGISISYSNSISIDMQRFITLEFLNIFSTSATVNSAGDDDDDDDGDNNDGCDEYDGITLLLLFSIVLI